MSSSNGMQLNVKALAPCYPPRRPHAPAIGRRRSGSGGGGRPLRAPPRGEARSANRTRWAGADGNDSSAGGQSPGGSDARQWPLATGRGGAAEPPAFRSPSATQHAAEAQRNALSHAAASLAAHPPSANGNGLPAEDIPATTQDAAAVVRRIASKFTRRWRRRSGRNDVTPCPAASWKSCNPDCSDSRPNACAVSVFEGVGCGIGGRSAVCGN